MKLEISIPDEIWYRAMHDQNALDISLCRTDAVNGYGACGHASATLMKFVEREMPDKFRPNSGRRTYERYWEPESHSTAKFEPIMADVAISLFDNYRERRRSDEQ